MHTTCMTYYTNMVIYFFLPHFLTNVVVLLWVPYGTN